MSKTVAIRCWGLGCLLLLLLATGCAFDLADAGEVRTKVPITTDSAAARRLYEEGRDLLEKILRNDAYRLFAAAVERDESFALAHLMMAETAPDQETRAAALEKAVNLVDRVTVGERMMILGTAASWKGDREGELAHFQQLAATFPEDERALGRLGRIHMERGELPLAITYYKRAAAVNPEFSQAYNQLGYAYRAIERWDEAERSFLRYIELMPEEANPYDSYAELLLEMGRFEDSLAQYRAALDRNPSFLPSLIGVGNNQLFLGDPVAARSTFQRLLELSHSDREKQSARLWSTVSYLHESRIEDALAQLEELRKMSLEARMPLEALQYRLMQGSILLETGALRDASEVVAEVATAAATELEKAAAEGIRRPEGLELRVAYMEARLALAREQVERADEIADFLRSHADTTGKKRSLRELEGRLALARGEAPEALALLLEASPRVPSVLWLRALAYREIGDEEKMLSHLDRLVRGNEFGGDLYASLDLALLRPRLEELRSAA